VTVCAQVYLLGRLSLPSIHVRLIEYWSFWLGLRLDAFTCVG